MSGLGSGARLAKSLDGLDEAVEELRGLAGLIPVDMTFAMAHIDGICAVNRTFGWKIYVLEQGVSEDWQTNCENIVSLLEVVLFEVRQISDEDLRKWLCTWPDTITLDDLRARLVRVLPALIELASQGL